MAPNDDTARTERPRARLFVEGDLADGVTVELARDRAHYLAHVLRLGSGASVALFNGRDGEWVGRIDALARNRARIAAVRQLRRQAAEPGPWLVFAPIKRAPLDYLVQKATELGAAALVPAVTRRTVVGRVNGGRLRAIAVEAAEQCERLTVPRIEEPAPLTRILEGWSAARRVLLCAETGEAEPIAEVLRDGAPDDGWAIVTGPEGGFEQTELDALRKLPFVTAVGLGPLILRADTAALAALACWQSILGDWRRRPPERP